MLGAEAAKSLRSTGHSPPCPLDRRYLLLNADYRPLGTFPPSIHSVRDGIQKLLLRKVEIVETWGDELIRSPGFSLPTPKVLALKTFAQVYQEPKFCRRNILLRDRFRCQYCGEPFTAQELTYDHVIPKSKGGKTVWTNIVAACVECNKFKANNLPNFSGRRGVVGSLRPLKEPRRPTAVELLRAGVEFWPREWIADFGSMAYWGVELLPA